MIALSGAAEPAIFGKLVSLTRRPQRVGRNPKSGEQVVVPEKRVPHFKPGKELRERVDLYSKKES